jgi:hypothetical protein
MPAWTLPLLCALFVPLTIFLIQPFAATGMNDDWAYIETARVLGKTGHIAYNGWSAPMLGWQLFLSDLLIHLFGFTFFVVRLGTVLTAALMGAVLQQLFVQGGLSKPLSMVATFSILASPLFLPLAFSYMTDVYGLFSLSLCLLLCMRAIQARTDRAALAWMLAAILSNAITGTTRQIAWLGVLAICPSALVLLRKRKGVVFPAAAALIVSWGFVMFCLRWFAAQPYTQAESLFAGSITATSIGNLLRAAGRSPLEMAMLLIPMLLLFVQSARRRSIVLLSVGIAAFLLLVALGFQLTQRPVLLYVFFPYLPNYLTVYGAVIGTFLQGVRPVVLSLPWRLLWTAFGLVGAGALLLVWRERRTAEPHRRSAVECGLSWQQLNMLVLPFLCVYLALLVPRSLDSSMFDRYLLVLLVVALLYLLRFYAERVPQQPLWPTVALLVVFGLYGIAITHDIFALHRARLAAVQQLLDHGLQPAEIDGGFEYNGLHEVQQYGYIPGPRMKETRDYVYPVVDERIGSCLPQAAELLPHLHPRYALSFQPFVCGGPAPFSPVTYTAWLGQHHVPLYVIRVGQRMTEPLEH